MMKSAKKMGLVFFPAFDWAISPGHPEREERLLYTQDQLAEEGIFDIDGIIELKPDIPTEEDVMRTHFCFPDVKSILTESHMVSAGGALRIARAVFEKEVDRGFALVRPPGHHAMKSVHGNRGFCNINNEAIMIEYIREHYGVKRVAIVDTDCHHGDGTQDIYWHDPDVLFISIHQDGRTLYPGSGAVDETGGPNARGETVNIPLPPETSDEGFLYAIDNVVLPILKDFKPDLVVNSAGQDNHYSDPITNMNFSAHGYAALNDRLSPDIAVLEGGYSVQGALPYVNLGIVLAMAGMDYSGVREPDFNAKALRQDTRIDEYIKKLSDVVLNIYFNPPEDNIYPDSSGFIKRNKVIFYDTDGIRENQTEYLKLCDKCAGTLILETESSRNPLSAGIEIPLNACPECVKAAENWLDKEEGQKRFSVIQLTDRFNRVYKRI